MRILLVHNRYQMPGGEDEVFEREKRLLQGKGHSVATYERDNAEIAGYGAWQKLTLAQRTVWNWDCRRELQDLLAREQPDVVHFHNTFPLISPAAYYACREAGVPVVQTLHNPRLLCPAGTFYRDGHLCEDCLGTRVFSPAVRYACYRQSRVQTAVVASMLSFHQWKGTWVEEVDLYIVSTEFYRRKFIEGGLPPEKLVVKPHFVSPDPGPRTEPGDYALFVGRLAPEKGVATLMRAWSRLKGIPLRIRGDGPLLEWVATQAGCDDSPTMLVGRQTSEAMVELVKGSRFLVWPSEGYYETFGLVAIEAFACGVPVIASRIGAMAEIVEDGRTGLCFTPGDPGDLAAKVEWAWSHPKEMEAMGRAARAEYGKRYTPENNYQMLMEIYARSACSWAPKSGQDEGPKLRPSASPRPSAAALGPREQEGARTAASAPGWAARPRPGPLRPQAPTTLGIRSGEIDKVLVVHNFYQQGGGEDVVFAAEADLLRAHGHRVVEYSDDNDRIESMNRVALASTTIWSRRARRDLESLLRREQPAVAHFHNTFPLISPAAYYACREAGVPVVQTLHNYRILCAAGNLHRGSRLCEDCLGKTLGWPGILHGCYRGSRVATGVVAAMVAAHWALKTWTDLVDVYVALTEFSRSKFIAGGLPGEKIIVKPNFPGVDIAPRSRPGNYALYLGRLSPEKGPGLLIGAWRGMRDDIPLRIAGDGPLRPALEEEVRAHRLRGVVLKGHVERSKALDLVASARFLVVPSQWYEAFPLVVVEAFASGVPVIAAKLGALAEVVEDGRSGLHFAPGDSQDLARKVEWAWNHPQEVEAMGRAARAEYEAKYTPDRNYQMLMEIYARAARTCTERISATA